MANVSRLHPRLAVAHLFAVALLVAVAPPLLAQESELRDDATGRVRARMQIYGEPTPGEQLLVLQEAAREAAKYSIGQPKFRATSQVQAAVQGAAWVNVGPAYGTQVSPLV